MNIEETAQGHFNSGYNCAEAVLLALAEQPRLQGMDLRMVVPRIATGFGGGLSRNGLICGALAGAAMAMGLVLGRDDPQSSREPCYPAVDRMVAEFRERFGSAFCYDLVRVDLKTKSGRKLYRQVVHDEVCRPLVAWTARRTEEIIGEMLSRSGEFV